MKKFDKLEKKLQKRMAKLDKKLQKRIAKLPDDKFRESFKIAYENKDKSNGALIVYEWFNANRISRDIPLKELI